MGLTAKSRLWLSRLLIAIVTGWNLQAALVFILWPERFMHGFELTGILFVMWNVPYLVALWNPSKYRLVLGIAIVMQLVGLVGESFILFTLPEGHALLSTSVLRFIIFDGSGLALLMAAFWILNRNIAPTQV